MKIPFVDLKRQYQNIKKEIDDAVHSVINETAFIKGKYVQQFENEFSKKMGIKHCIGVGNGTDAIYITLKCLGIGIGDEVITVANSWISTSESITQTGAKPVFVDIETDYYTIDPDKIEEKITPKTKAVIPVHLYGQSAKIDTIKNICKKHNLHLIEDCAQAHFAEYNNKKVGTFGIASTFSFYPSKNLGAYGDAGAIITNSDVLAQKIRMYANHGSLKKHQHTFEGINSRLDGLQAAILSVKLRHIDKWNKDRFDNAMNYNSLLKKFNFVQIPKVRKKVRHIFHLYVIQIDDRDGLIEFLKKNEIGVAIHYPTALPFLKAYQYLNHKKNDFPIAFEYQNKILSLPMFPELKKDEIEFIAGVIQQYFNK